MGRGKRQGGFAPPGWRPDMNSFVRVEEALQGELAAEVARPVLRAQERGVIGWCVSSDECAEVCRDSATPVPLYDVPVPVALLAWDQGRLDFDDVLRVLAAHDQLQKPGFERVLDDEDGHFYGVCWCGWEGELCLTHAAAERELSSHGDAHVPA